jgi:hypothetical protein
MRLRPLTRLRLGFVALGFLLLTPLGLLLNAVDDRIQAQRRLRHDVVAERIFDELERELTALLESESKRPSAAYGETTRIEAWAPFVVGYFRLSTAPAAAAPELLAQAQLDALRSRRLLDVLGEFALAKASPGQSPLPAPSVVPEPPQDSNSEFQHSIALPISAKSLGPAQSSPEVLQKLNRSQEERKQKVRSKASGSRSEDPMTGF